MAIRQDCPCPDLPFFFSREARCLTEVVLNQQGNYPQKERHRLFVQLTWSKRILWNDDTSGIQTKHRTVLKNSRRKASSRSSYCPVGLEASELNSCFSFLSFSFFIILFQSEFLQHEEPLVIRRMSKVDALMSFLKRRLD